VVFKQRLKILIEKVVNINIVMHKKPFAKLRLLYIIIQHITDARQIIIKDLVAYLDDPVRYKRRMRFLIQLADYEQQLLIKIENLDNDPCHYNDHMIKQLKDEIDLITNHSS
jgi:hypothetical protein